MTNSNQIFSSIPSNDSLVVLKTLVFRMGCNMSRKESPMLEVQVCVPRDEFGKVSIFQIRDGNNRPNSYGIYVRTKEWNAHIKGFVPIFTRISLTKYIEMLSVFNYNFVGSIKGTHGRSLREANMFMKGYMTHFLNL